MERDFLELTDKEKEQLCKDVAKAITDVLPGNALYTIIFAGPKKDEDGSITGAEVFSGANVPRMVSVALMQDYIVNLAGGTVEKVGNLPQNIPMPIDVGVEQGSLNGIGPMMEQIPGGVDYKFDEEDVSPEKPNPENN